MLCTRATEDAEMRRSPLPSAVAIDDRREVEPRRERAEGLAPVAGEAGGAEGVGDGFIAVADEEGGLEGEGHFLDDAAGVRVLYPARGVRDPDVVDQARLAEKYGVATGAGRHERAQ